ncbi:MAG: hypothetical protein WDM85_06720 [Caulobacteraceae bacterium]
MDLTGWLAVLQTVAGFGAILATIIFTIVQRVWSRNDDLRRKLEFIWAATDLIGGFNDVTAKLVELHERLPDDAIHGAARLEWLTTWAIIKDALEALRDHSVSDAPVVLSLAHCVRIMDRAATVQNARNGLDLRTQAAAFAREMTLERTNLLEREASLAKHHKALRRRKR